MAEFTCPKCGHRQPAGGAECVACGVVFAKVLQARQRAATGGSARPEARRRTSAARIVFLLLLVVLAVVVWRQASLGRLSCAGGAGGPAAATRSDVLVTGEAAPAGAVTIGLYDPIELDGMTRAEVEQLRTYYVDKHPELVREYTPSSAVFGQIVDGLPWWGVEGQFCDGPGERGIDGDSEEARWVINPFLLLGVDEGQAFIVSDPGCFPVYPSPATLTWDAAAARAEVKYDLSRFLEEKERVGLLERYGVLELVNYNARDMGFTHVHVDDKRSPNIGPSGDSLLQRSAVVMQGYLHAGGSCGYPGGCNNKSPAEPDMRFTVRSLPATLHAKLWRGKPASPADPADFTFVIEFR